jgi:23S rRNA (guanine2445-N2)-methyltransferase / 23S rRNA (guanine2069-N7)-methyltransferase
MPEYNLAIDLFEQWVHVQEYAPPATVAPDKAKERFNLALQVIRNLLAVPHSDLFLKTRQKQQSKQPRKKQSRTGKLYEVHEGGGRFLVNFTDFQDTGLLLDQRKIRALIGEISSGRTFLNLFSYTGSATVCAAMGGATSTVTVELSDQYLARAKANLSLNGFGGPLHRFIPADCMQWLKSGRERYGVIVVDAPTFARHQNLVFDIQQDHEQLLCLAMERLSREGILIFSNNSRKFKLDPTLTHKFNVEEITNQTIPEDFKRSKHIHSCYRFTHRAEIISE